MKNLAITSTVLLVSANPQIHLLIRDVRSTADKNNHRPEAFSYTPLLCVDDLPSYYRYLRYYHDMDSVMIDSVLLDADSFKSLQHNLRSVMGHYHKEAKLVLLCTSLKELHRMSPPMGTQFRLLSLNPETRNFQSDNLRL